MTDDQLLELHRRAHYASRIGVCMFAGLAWVALADDWPRWALWLTVMPVAAVVVVSALLVVPFCRWLEVRRGWSEPAEVMW